MNDNSSWIPFDVMERFMNDVFKGLGVPVEEAAICADVLIAAANKKNGCKRTLTFDKKAGHDLSGMELTV